MADEQEAPPPAPEAKSVLAWAAAKGTPGWLLRATAVRLRWEIAAEVVPTATTEAEFDEATTTTLTMRI